MQYHQQMKHPLWQKKRLDVLEDRGFECENCGSGDIELHVHHPFYKRGAMIWDYDKDELRCLCTECHKNEHALDEKIKLLLSEYGTQKEEIIGFLKGMHDNPWTKLDDYGEITGYMKYYGIDCTPLEKSLINEPIPERLFRNSSPSDIGYVIRTIIETKFNSILKKAVSIRAKRMASMKKEADDVF